MFVHKHCQIRHGQLAKALFPCLHWRHGGKRRRRSKLAPAPSVYLPSSLTHNRVTERDISSFKRFTPMKILSLDLIHPYDGRRIMFIWLVCLQANVDPGAEILPVVAFLATSPPSRIILPASKGSNHGKGGRSHLTWKRKVTIQQENSFNMF